MGGFISNHLDNRSHKICGYLKQTPFFLVFDEDELRQYTKYFDLKQLSQGQIIRDARFIVVLQGSLSISTILPKSKHIKKQMVDAASPEADSQLCALNKREQKHNQTKQKHKCKQESLVFESLCVKKSGDFFTKASNEFSSTELNRKVVETFDFTTVKVMEDSSTLILNSQKYKQFLNTEGSNSTLLNKILNLNLNKLLREVPFLKDLKSSTMAVLSEMFCFESFQAGMNVVNEGEITTRFYLVLSGSVEVRTRTIDEECAVKSTPLSMKSVKSVYSSLKNTQMSNDSKGVQMGKRSRLSSRSSRASARSSVEVQLQHLVAGSFFGEMALMFRLPRIATVATKEKCLLAYIDEQDFHSFTKLVPMVEDSFLLHAKERCVDLLSKFMVPLFCDLKASELVQRASHCDLFSYQAKDIINTPEEIATSVYFVIRGKLSKVLQEPQPADSSTRETVSDEAVLESGFKKMLYPGDYFGEVAALLKVPGPYRIEAESTCLLFEIPMEVLRDCFSEMPELWTEFEMKALGPKKTSLAQVMSHKLSRASFLQHLRDEHSDESFLFLQAVYDFKALCQALSQLAPDHEQLENMKLEVSKSRQEIIDRYICCDAEKQINISDCKRNDILNQVGEVTTVDEHLFDAAREEVFKLIERDTFQRFKATPLFQHFWERAVPIPT